MSERNAQRISPQLRDIHAPAPLRDLPLWCVWAYEQHEGETKLRKVPQYSMGGRRYGKQGSPEDRAKLTTFAVARDAAMRRGMDGVGFALLPDTGIVALDFDKCVVDGKVDPEVKALVLGTYCELSPSGTGVRAFFRGSADVLGNRKSPATADQFGAEVFSDTGFCTVTGWMLDHVDLVGHEDTVAPLPKKVIDFCERRFGATRPAAPSDDFMAGHEPKLGLSAEQMADLVGKLDPDVSRDEWIRVGMALHHETDGGEDGFELWNDWSSNGYKYPSEEALRSQWDSFERRKGSARRNITMATVIKMAKECGSPPETAFHASPTHFGGSNSWSGMRASRFPILTAAEIAQRSAPSWLVKGLVPAAGLIVLYGQPGSGKSFVAFDLAAAISQGKSWCERRVKKSRVIYIAAEGGGGFRDRVKAYCAHNSIDANGLEVHFIIAAPNFLQDGDISEVIAAINNVGSVGLVVVDTLAQVTPGGNENSSEDMGKAIFNAHRIAESVGSAVMLVHHEGKDSSRGARGWSGLNAAADAEIKVARGQGGHRTIKVTKMKDGPDDAEFDFRLVPVSLGTDSEGDPLGSCIVDCIPMAGVKSKRPAGADQKVIYDLVEGGGASGIDERQLVDAACARKRAAEREKTSNSKHDKTRSNMQRTLKTMLEKSYLARVGERVFLPKFARQAETFV